MIKARIQSEDRVRPNNAGHWEISVTIHSLSGGQGHLVEWLSG